VFIFQGRLKLLTTSQVERLLLLWQRMDAINKVAVVAVHAFTNLGLLIKMCVYLFIIYNLFIGLFASEQNRNDNKREIPVYRITSQRTYYARHRS